MLPALLNAGTFKFEVPIYLMSDENLLHGSYVPSSLPIAHDGRARLFLGSNSIHASKTLITNDSPEDPLPMSPHYRLGLSYEFWEHINIGSVGVIYSLGIILSVVSIFLPSAFWQFQIFIR